MQGCIGVDCDTPHLITYLEKIVRSINITLDKLEKHWFANYTCLREVIMEEDMFTCICFINNIKEHRYVKIKNRQIYKFERLLRKSGYHHNLQTNIRFPPSVSILNDTTSVVLQQSNNTNGKTTTTTTTTRCPTTNTMTATTTTSTMPTFNSNPDAPTGSSNKWVINLSSKPLTPAQSSLLSRGTNFAITPKHPHRSLHHTIEETCTKLTQGEAEKLRVEISHLLKHKCPQHTKHHKGRIQGQKELREDQSRIVLTVAKGVAKVIMDKQQYTAKATALLQDTNTYRTIPKDSTTKLKINLLAFSGHQTNRRTQEHNILQGLPHKCSPTKVLWPSQIQKVGTPLRPIVFSRGSITYRVAKELAGIICPLVGESQHHLKNTQHFIEKIQQVKLQQGEVISSYDVKTLFASVPVDTAITIVQQRLTQDPTLPPKGPKCPFPKLSHSWSSASKTPTSSPKVSTMNRSMVQPWVPYQPPHSQPVHGRVWSQSPPICPPLPSLWLRFVDDTLVIQKAEHSQQLLQLTGPQHVNHSRRTRIRWLLTISGYQSYTRAQQHHSHQSLQETNTHRSIPTLGQQSFHYSQEQCIQHPSS